MNDNISPEDQERVRKVRELAKRERQARGLSEPFEEALSDAEILAELNAMAKKAGEDGDS